MSGFKLLAIVPLEGCDSQYRKNLEVGTPYQFYSNYDIKIKEDLSEIISAKALTSEIPKVNRLPNGMYVNYCAVVGGNGSGKSTLIELLYYMVYAISSDNKIGSGKLLRTELDNLIIKRSVAISDYNILNSLYDKVYNSKIWKPNSNKDIARLMSMSLDIQRKYDIDLGRRVISDARTFVKSIKAELVDNVLRRLYSKIKDEKKWESFFRANFACSILYEKDNKIKEVAYDKKGFIFNDYSSKEKMKNSNVFEMEDFFYSISLNFSHHSLNSNTLGNWINRLFHKNDAYTTPLVINPMRTEGNFEINKELKLSTERLMANVLYDLVNEREMYLLDKYEVSSFIFRPKTLSGYPSFEKLQEDFSKLNSYSLFKQLLNIEVLEKVNDYWYYAIMYLEGKIERISEHYGDQIFSSNSKRSQKEQLDWFIVNDKSHITKKIRQVVNFLKITHKEKQSDSIWRVPVGTVEIKVSDKRLKDWLNHFNIDFINMSPSELVEFGHPGFFTVDFLLKDTNENEIVFSRLSSGEQQMIFNTNSILYHIYNLQSVHNNNNNNKSKHPNHMNLPRIKYSDINVVLDEIEMYYHPDMQRKLVWDLNNNLERLSMVDGGVTSINICFLTHSPFILSDIPSTNILRLDKGRPIPNEKETFAGNIHDLLANDFFLSDGYIGEFAKEKINNIIAFYHEVCLIDNNKFKDYFSKYQAKREYFYYVLSIIGEPVIKTIVENHVKFLDDYFKVK